MSALSIIVLQVVVIQLVECQFNAGGGGGPGTFGYDASSACTKPYSRNSRAHFEKLPCDFQRQNWCTVAGKFYPWQAVRRFVYENQGLMRRMYGDERHISVLKNELEKNDVDLEIDDRYQRYNSRRSFLFDNEYEFEEDDFQRSSNEYQTRGFSHKLPKFRDLTKLYPEYSQETSPPPSKTYSSTFIPTTSTTSTTTTTSTIISEALSSSTETSSTISHEPTTKLFKSNNSTKYYDNNNNMKSNLNLTEENRDKTKDKIRTTLPMTLAEIARVKNSSFNEIQGYSETSGSSTSTKGNLSNTTVELLGIRPIEIDTTLSPAGFSEASTTLSEQFNLSTEGFKEATTSSPSHETFKPPRPEFNSANKPESSGMASQLFQDVVKDQTEPPVLKLRGINACPVKEEVVAPFWANNTRGEVLALLNLYPFEQYVHWEKCTHEKKQMYCRDGCRCEQQYRLHRLLAYDPNNECRGIFSDWFKFPSCCICRCYDLPLEFRVTSRSPRLQRQKIKLRPPGDQ